MSVDMTAAQIVVVQTPPPVSLDVKSRLAAQGASGVLGTVSTAVRATEGSVVGGLKTANRVYDPNIDNPQPESVRASSLRGGPLLSPSSFVNIAGYSLDSPVASDIRSNAVDKTIDTPVALMDDKKLASLQAENDAQVALRQQAIDNQAARNEAVSEKFHNLEASRARQEVAAALKADNAQYQASVAARQEETRLAGQEAESMQQARAMAEAQHRASAATSSSQQESHVQRAKAQDDAEKADRAAADTTRNEANAAVFDRAASLYAAAADTATPPEQSPPAPTA